MRLALDKVNIAGLKLTRDAALNTCISVILKSFQTPLIPGKSFPLESVYLIWLIKVSTMSLLMFLVQNMRFEVLQRTV